MLRVAPLVRLVRVQLAVHEGQLISCWEKVTLRTHSNAHLRIVISHQLIPGVAWHYFLVI